MLRPPEPRLGPVGGGGDHGVEAGAGVVGPPAHGHRRVHQLRQGRLGCARQGVPGEAAGLVEVPSEEGELGGDRLGRRHLRVGGGEGGEAVRAPLLEVELPGGGPVAGAAAEMGGEEVGHRFGVPGGGGRPGGVEVQPGPLRLGEPLLGQPLPDQLQGPCRGPGPGEEERRGLQQGRIPRPGQVRLELGAGLLQIVEADEPGEAHASGVGRIRCHPCGRLEVGEALVEGAGGQARPCHEEPGRRSVGIGVHRLGETGAQRLRVPGVGGPQGPPEGPGSGQGQGCDGEAGASAAGRRARH